MASVNPFARAAASGFGWAPSIAKGLGAANPFQAAAKDSLSGASSIPLPRKTDGGARWARIVNAVARKSGAARGEDEIDWAVAADPAAAGDEDDPLADEIEALCLDEEQPRRPQWGSANKKNNKEKPRDKHSYEYLHRHLKDLPQSSRLSEEDRARLDAALRPAFPEKRPLEWPACAPEVLNAQNDCLEIYVLYPDYEIERRPAKGEPGGPVVRIVGKTLQGRTVMLRAHSKLPYWYFRPRGRLLEALQRDEPRTLAWIRERLNQIARDKRTSEREARGQAQGEGRKGSDPDAVVAVTLENDRRSTYGYEHETSAFVRVTMREPGLVPCVRDAVATKRFAWHDELPEALPYERFEADIPYVLRFMIDGGVTGCGWVRVPRAALSQPKERKSRCELELLVDAAQVKGAPDIKATPPLRFLSYDIECAGRKGRFPTPDQDPVICISATVYDLGRETPVREVCLGLGSVDPVGGQARKKRTKDPRSGQWSEKDLAWEAPAVVTFGGHARRGGRPVRVFPEHDRADEFDTDAEARMILAFRALMVEYSDLDFLSGYNISGFDNDYLLKRADALGIGWQFRDFSRLREHPCDNPPKTFESKAWGKRETKELKCPGRVEYDTLRLVLRDMMMKLRSYTLDAVAQKVLAGAKKAAVSHEKITPWWLGEEATPATRRRVLEYNLLDSQLSWYIADTLAYFYTNEALARLTGVPFEFIFKNGQGVRTTSMLARKLAPQRKLIPSFSDEEKRALRRDYEGATVLDPRRGWYTSPLSTNAAEPTWQAHNLGYSSYVLPRYYDARATEATGKAVLRPGAPPWLRDFADKDLLEITPKGALFIKESVVQAETTEALRELLTERFNVKAEMKKETDELRLAVLDGRQNSIKISANSVYGYTGNPVGQMPCVEIAEGVTSFGRRYILMVKRGIERDMPWPDQFFSYLREKVDGAGIAPPDGFRSWEAAIRAGHYRPICISGDTDSVMVAWPACYHIEPCILLGKHASKWCTETLFHARGRKDMNLAWEKAMRNALFTAPKRYAYGYVKEDGKMDHLEVKGMEAVRRDNSQMARDVMKDVFQHLIVEGDPLKAFLKAERVVEDLAAGRINVHHLVITKSLSREPSECTEAAREQTYRKLLKREQDSALSAESQRKRPATGAAAQRKKQETKKAKLAVDPARLMGGPAKPEAPAKQGTLAALFEMRAARSGSAEHEVRSVARQMGLLPGATTASADAEARARAELDKYTKYGNQIHVNLANRMHERDANSAPHCNDRVPYVVVRRGRDAKLGQCGEDPTWAIEHQVPIDYQYYLDRQLRKPLERVFEHLHEDCMRVLVDREEARPRATQRGIEDYYVRGDEASSSSRLRDNETADKAEEAEDLLAAADGGFLARMAAEAEEAASAMPERLVKDDERYEPSERTYQWLCKERERALAPLREELMRRSTMTKRSFGAASVDRASSDADCSLLDRLLRLGGSCEACRRPVAPAEGGGASPALCPGCAADRAVSEPRIAKATAERDESRARSMAAWRECARCVGARPDLEELEGWTRRAAAPERHERGCAGCGTCLPDDATATRCVSCADSEALMCENRGCENLLYRLQVKTEAEVKERRLARYRPRVEVAYEEAEPMEVDS